MKFRKRALCSILLGAFMACSALALTANVTGKWITGSTTAAHQAGVTADTARDMGNPADAGRYVDRYEFPSSRMSDKQKKASDELAKTLAIRDEAIIASFGLDLTDFRRIPITQLEMVEQCETVVQDIVMEIIPIYGIHAGDSRAVGLLRADNALLYIAKRDAAGVNHLYAYAPDDNDRWHLIDETTTQADAADIAAVKQANEAYQAALAEGF
ncbi:MAG: hypothetical protein MR935_02695 [Agathobaculum sp.]|uniref:hypothetical protein n=1 Tax=Agathobaculum sp. TaxID=2048138 RepID=UPI0025C62337|nr:hypothetical protein [Agathobaculum sp.]MCI7125099.1 hypothetical protein [Agathobaculum sp.]MDY3711588.1 hypothetical protein [Agathobaculum sp.]